ncbi:MAG: hypothetical protein ACLS4Z_06770 [Christensenellaceae bacterium]
MYKKIETATWGRCKAFFKNYAGFLNEHRIYILAAGLIWSYNLNAVTIVMEFFAFVFYFAVSFDALGIFTQIAKLAMDLTVAINFLPWWSWAVVGFLIFDAIRKNIGTQRLLGMRRGIRFSGIAPGGAVRGREAACEKNDDDHGYGALTRGNLPRKGERKTASAGYAVPVLPVDSVGKVSGRRDSGGIFPDIGESTAVYRVSEIRLRVT